MSSLVIPKLLKNLTDKLHSNGNVNVLIPLHLINCPQLIIVENLSQENYSTLVHTSSIIFAKLQKVKYKLKEEVSVFDESSVLEDVEFHISFPKNYHIRTIIPKFHAKQYRSFTSLCWQLCR